MATGSLDDARRRGEHRRTEVLRDSVADVVNWGVYGLAGIAAILVVVVVFHHILPEYWHWVEPEVISTLTKFLVGTVVGFLACAKRIWRHVHVPR